MEIVNFTTQERTYFNILKAIGKLRLSEKVPEKVVKKPRLKTKIMKTDIDLT